VVLPARGFPIPPLLRDSTETSASHSAMTALSTLAIGDTSSSVDRVGRAHEVAGLLSQRCFKHNRINTISVHQRQSHLISENIRQRQFTMILIHRIFGPAPEWSFSRKADHLNGQPLANLPANRARSCGEATDPTRSVISAPAWSLRYTGSLV